MGAIIETVRCGVIELFSGMDHTVDAADTVDGGVIKLFFTAPVMTIMMTV